MLKKLLLNPFSLIFKAVSYLNLRRKSLKQKRYPGALIVSIDNLSFGGTGKTSMVIDLGRQLQLREIPFAIVTRGYRSAHEKEGLRVETHHQAAAVGDEPKLMKTYFPDRDVFIGRDRHASIVQAIMGGNRVILLDDGFQSTDIYKDIKIMLLNPSHPYYYLRNFKCLTKAEDYVLYYRQVPASASTGLSRVGNYDFERENFCDIRGQVVEPGDNPLYGFSALGDNDRFKTDLSAFCLAGFKGFPDHHAYTVKDLDALNHLAKQAGAGFLVCTEKDAVKLPRPALENNALPIIYARSKIVYDIDLARVILEKLQVENFAESMV